ncbi:hypothetical protein ACGFX8_16780 [Streptomyces sp. NPDC048362]|uniref:hypothetical protein n=1 Tax=Streptomyces sp. NPDC048362 TaxID=3365539 RepID=UPI003713DAB7
MLSRPSSTGIGHVRGRVGHRPTGQRTSHIDRTAPQPERRADDRTSPPKHRAGDHTPRPEHRAGRRTSQSWHRSGHSGHLDRRPLGHGFPKGRT